jgi:hypothetical protein
MKVLVHNRCNRHVYFNKYTQTIHENIWNLLNADTIAKSRFLAHDFNSDLLINTPDFYQEVIPGIVPLPPFSRWLYNGRNFECCSQATMPYSQKASMEDLLSVSRRLLKPITKMRIAVDLSGGLDSAIIIGLLEHHNIKPFLIGMKNNRYEFRTESLIQELYTDRYEHTLLFDNEEHLPFSELLKTPTHQLPSSTSVFHSTANYLASKYDENEIKLVFNGNGIDTLFCDDPLIDGNARHPKSWFTWMLDNNWLNEYVFNKYGIAYVPAAASKALVRTIWLMRKDEKEDHKKLWARRTFADYLPAELVNYTYKADHVGLFMDGLWNAANDIMETFRATYDITKWIEFKPSQVYQLLENLQTYNERKEKLICSRVSFASWVYSLVKDNFLTK